MTTIEAIEHQFDHHPPGQGNIMKHEIVRDRCKKLAVDLVDLCPPSRERALALRKLEETMFWANAAIARGK